VRVIITGTPGWASWLAVAVAVVVVVPIVAVVAVVVAPIVVVTLVVSATTGWWWVWEGLASQELGPAELAVGVSSGPRTAVV
jgi:hypothetical protein